MVLALLADGSISDRRSIVMMVPSNVIFERLLYQKEALSKYSEPPHILGSNVPIESLCFVSNVGQAQSLTDSSNIAACVIKAFLLVVGTTYLFVAVCRYVILNILLNTFDPKCIRSILRCNKLRSRTPSNIRHVNLQVSFDSQQVQSFTH